MNCSGCGTERAMGQTCPTCERTDDPVPMDIDQVASARLRWRRDEKRHALMLKRQEARKAEIGAEAHTAELDDGLRSIGVLR